MITRIIISLPRLILILRLLLQLKLFYYYYCGYCNSVGRKIMSDFCRTFFLSQLCIGHFFATTSLHLLDKLRIPFHAITTTVATITAAVTAASLRTVKPE